jgi:sulfatase modifying factor 1
MRNTKITGKSRQDTGLNMILVEGGTFNMGGEIQQELPVHSRTVNSFYMSQTPVLTMQYAEFCRSKGRAIPSQPWMTGDQHYDYTPVVNVSWSDADEFCKWMSQKHGKKFRLPTEAEWEFAAKGGRKTRGYVYSGSNNPSEVSWCKDFSGNKAHEVKQKRPNELDLYDMSGNVWEWCDDWYRDYLSNQSSEWKTVRGGSWNYDCYRSRSSARGYFSPDLKLDHVGFRIVMEP